MWNEWNVARIHGVFDVIILEGIATIAAHYIATNLYGNTEIQKKTDVVASIDLTNKIDGVS